MTVQVPQRFFVNLDQNPVNFHDHQHLRLCGAECKYGWGISLEGLGKTMTTLSQSS